MTCLFFSCAGDYPPGRARNTREQTVRLNAARHRVFSCRGRSAYPPETQLSAPLGRPLRTCIEVAAEYGRAGQASDVHIEPREDCVRVRFRTQGAVITLFFRHARASCARSTQLGLRRAPRHASIKRPSRTKHREPIPTMSGCPPVPSPRSAGLGAGMTACYGDRPTDQTGEARFGPRAALSDSDFFALFSFVPCACATAR